MAIVTVDMLTQDPDTGEFVVYLNEDGPWPADDQGWADVLHRIQERIFDAIHLVLDGAVAEKFPQLKGSKGRVQVHCPSGVPSPIKELVVTDTVQHDPNTMPPKVTELSVAALLGEAVQRIHEERSLSSLFV